MHEGALVVAVQRFQRRHGLEANGRIDKTTVTELNILLGFPIRQLELALERWRRRPYDPSAIVLNVPEFPLRAARANHVDLEMKSLLAKLQKLRSNNRSTYFTTPLRRSSRTLRSNRRTKNTAGAQV